MMSNPQLPLLSDREIYAMSHPSSPDFESEMFAKSFYEAPKLKHALPFDPKFFAMHEAFDDSLLKNTMEDHK